MSLSIITPHFNDLEGLRCVYACLQEQTLEDWSWVIVDDKSTAETQEELQKWVDSLSNSQVQLFLNPEKTNASVCRNIGADLAKTDTLVFLDSDDIITSDFVANRNVSFAEFAVFKNTAVLDKKRGKIPLYKAKGNYLNYFLCAKFIWPITAILWQRDFFNTIGGFHSDLPRLQDVELAIRALQKSKKYTVFDLPIDFYYRVNPIRERKNFVAPVCNAVYLFISKLLQIDALNKHQLSLISGYYFLCVKYFERSGSKVDAQLVQRNLKLFYSKHYINFINYFLGLLLLKFYTMHIISGKFFLRANRYLFKPRLVY